MTKAFKSLLAVSIACLMLATPRVRAEAPPREHQVKAAFIYNFVQFTQWPAKGFEKSDSPIVIGVMGQTLVKDALAQLIKDKTVQGRPLQLKALENAASTQGCHVLFVGSEHRGQLVEILEKAAHQGMLTVGDVEPFTRAGGMIRLFLEEKKVRFEIRPKMAERAGLKISSKLLKLARIYPD